MYQEEPLEGSALVLVEPGNYIEPSFSLQYENVRDYDCKVSIWACIRDPSSVKLAEQSPITWRSEDGPVLSIMYGEGFDIDLFGMKLEAVKSVGYSGPTFPCIELSGYEMTSKLELCSLTCKSGPALSLMCTHGSLVKGCSVHDVESTGILVPQGQSSTHIDNCRLFSITGSEPNCAAISVRGNDSDAVIENCKIYDCSAGINVVGSAEACIFKNELYSITGVCIQVGGEGTYCEIVDNTIHNNVPICTSKGSVGAPAVWISDGATVHTMKTNAIHDWRGCVPIVVHGDSTAKAGDDWRRDNEFFNNEALDPVQNFR